MKLNVILTKSYRLTSDGERNFTIEQRVTVDPSKSPSYLKRLKTEPDAIPDPPYEDWRDTGNYYGMTAGGLAAALEFVAVRAAVEDFAEAYDYCDLREFAEGLRSESERLRRAVSGLITEVGA